MATEAQGSDTKAKARFALMEITALRTLFFWGSSRSHHDDLILVDFFLPFFVGMVYTYAQSYSIWSEKGQI